MKAMYNCVADNPDELTFSEGEVIVVDGEEDQEWWVSVLTSLSNIRSEGTREEKLVDHISLLVTGWLLLSKLGEGSVSLAEYGPAACFPPNCLHFHWPCLVIHSPLRLIGGSAKSPNLCSCAIDILQWFQAAVFLTVVKNTVVKILIFCCFCLNYVRTV